MLMNKSSSGVTASLKTLLPLRRDREKNSAEDLMIFFFKKMRQRVDYLSQLLNLTHSLPSNLLFYQDHYLVH